MALHLVRHGPPLIDPTTPASSWHLDPDEVDRVRELAEAGVLPQRARWVSSDEPKAVETARILAGDADVEVLEDLREQYRPAGWVDAYAVRVHRSVIHPDEPPEEGWETAGATRVRVARTVRALVEETPGDVVLVGHGTAWTLAVAELTGSPVDLVAWERMQLPDHCVIDGGEVVRPWGAWRSG